MNYKTYLIITICVFLSIKGYTQQNKQQNALLKQPNKPLATIRQRRLYESDYYIINIIKKYPNENCLCDSRAEECLFKNGEGFQIYVKEYSGFVEFSKVNNCKIYYLHQDDNVTCIKCKEQTLFIDNGTYYCDTIGAIEGCSIQDKQSGNCQACNSSSQNYQLYYKDGATNCKIIEDAKTIDNCKVYEYQSESVDICRECFDGYPFVRYEGSIYCRQAAPEHVRQFCLLYDQLIINGRTQLICSQCSSGYTLFRNSETDFECKKTSTSGSKPQCRIHYINDRDTLDCFECQEGFRYFTNGNSSGDCRNVVVPSNIQEKNQNCKAFYYNDYNNDITIYCDICKDGYVLGRTSEFWVYSCSQSDAYVEGCKYYYPSEDTYICQECKYYNSYAKARKIGTFYTLQDGVYVQSNQNRCILQSKLDNELKYCQKWDQDEKCFECSDDALTIKQGGNILCINKNTQYDQYSYTINQTYGPFDKKCRVYNVDNQKCEQAQDEYILLSTEDLQLIKPKYEFLFSYNHNIEEFWKVGKDDEQSNNKYYIYSNNAYSEQQTATPEQQQIIDKLGDCKRVIYYQETEQFTCDSFDTTKKITYRYNSESHQVAVMANESSNRYFFQCKLYSENRSLNHQCELCNDAFPKIPIYLYNEEKNKYYNYQISICSNSSLIDKCTKYFQYLKNESYPIQCFECANDYVSAIHGGGSKCYSLNFNATFYDNRNCQLLQYDYNQNYYPCQLCKEGFYLDQTNYKDVKCQEIKHTDNVPVNCRYINYNNEVFTCIGCNYGYQLVDNECQQIPLVCPEPPYDCHDSTQKNMILLNYCKETDVTYDQLQKEDILPTQSICKQCYNEETHTKIDLYNYLHELVYTDVCVLKTTAKNNCSHHSLNFDCMRCNEHYKSNGKTGGCKLLYLEEQDEEECNGFNEDPYSDGLCTACKNNKKKPYDLYQLKEGKTNVYIKNNYKQQICMNKLQNEYSIYNNQREEIKCQLLIKKIDGSYECYQDYNDEVSSQYENCLFFDEEENKCKQCKLLYKVDELDNKTCTINYNVIYDQTCKQKSDNEQQGHCTQCNDNQLLVTLYKYNDNDKYTTDITLKNVCVTPNEPVCAFYNNDLECQETEKYFIETEEEGNYQYQEADESANEIIKNCLVINGNTCKLCKINYTLINNKCIINTTEKNKKIQYCLMGQILQSYKCDKCYYGYFNEPPKYQVCTKDVPNCLSYDEEGFCQQCEQNYFLVQFEFNKQCIDKSLYNFYQYCDIAYDLDEEGNLIKGYCKQCNEQSALIQQIYKHDQNNDKFIPNNQLQNICQIKENKDDFLYLFNQQTSQIQVERCYNQEQEMSIVQIQDNNEISYQCMNNTNIQPFINNCLYYKQEKINEENKYTCQQCKYGFVGMANNDNKIIECQDLSSLDNQYLQYCLIKEKENDLNKICYQCLDGYSLYNVQDNTNKNNPVIIYNVCFPENSHCLLYNEKYSCLQCEPYYVLQPSQNEQGKQIQICSHYNEVEHCEQYDDNYNCILCQMGFTLQINESNKQLNQCLDYSLPENQLLQFCKIKAAINNDNKQCQKCYNNYILKDKDVNNTIIKDICEERVKYCKEYDDNNICIDCQQGFMLEEEQKQDGQASYYCLSPVKYCQEYNENHICIQCEFGFTLEINEEDEQQNKCLNWNYPENKYYKNCKIKDNSNIENNYCQECFDNYLLSSIIDDTDKDNLITIDNVCIHYIDNCNEYGTDLECKECIQSYTLEINRSNIIIQYQCLNQLIQDNRLYKDCIIGERNDNNNNNQICTKCNGKYESIFGPDGNDDIGKNSIIQLCVYYSKFCEKYSQYNVCESCRIGFDLLPFRSKQQRQLEEENNDNNIIIDVNQYLTRLQCYANIMHCSIYREDGKCAKCKRYFNLKDGFCYINKYSFDNCLYQESDYRCGKCKKGIQRVQIDLEGEQYSICLSKEKIYSNNQSIYAVYFLLSLLLVFYY